MSGALAAAVPVDVDAGDSKRQIEPPDDGKAPQLPPLPLPTGPTLLNPRLAIEEGPYRDWWRFFLFLRSWSLVYNISTRSTETLYRVLRLLVPTLAAAPAISNYIIDKTLQIDSCHDAFVGYVACPSCH